MKLERWALIAEVVGSFAVVVTLVILISEVRVNTELARVAAYDAVSRDFDQNRRDWLSDPEHGELFFQFTQGVLPDIQSEPEMAFKAGVVLLNSFSSLERAFLAYQADVLNEEDWPRIRRSACSDWDLLRGTEYYAPVTFRLTDRFVDYLNTACTQEYLEAIGQTNFGELTERPELAG